MNSKMVTGLLVLSALLSATNLTAGSRKLTFGKIVAECSVDQMLIDQQQIDDAGGTLTLACSGEYRAKENLVGTIVIGAPSISLDLASHSLDANGADNAIVIQGTPLEGSVATRSVTPKKPIVQIPNLSEFQKNRGIFSQGKDLHLEINRPAFRTARKADILVSDILNVKVSNGTVLGSVDAAILVDSAFNVVLSDLTLLNNDFDAIRVLNSNVVKISNITVAGINTAGEGAALFFDSSDNLTITSVIATNYLSTNSAIIEINFCNAVSMKDVDVTSNTKTSAGNIEFFAVATAFVGVTGSTGVDFVSVKVNNNTISNTIPVDDPNTNWRTFEAIEFSFSSGCTLTNCETSFNTDVAGSTDLNCGIATTDTEDFMLCLIFCDNFVVTNHQSSNNSCEQPILYFTSTAVFDSNSIVLDGVQASNNFVAELILASFPSEMINLWLSQYFSFESTHDNVLRNSQANFNTVAVGGAGRTAFGDSAYIIGIQTGGVNCIVDHSQANNTIMEDAEPNTGVIGLLSVGNDALVSNVTSNNNIGGASSMGILLYFTRVATRGINPVVRNTTSSFNGNYGISVGVDEDLTQTNADVTIINSIINKNGSGTGPAAGIIIQPVIGGTRKVLIKGAQIYETGSAASTSAAGISVANANNVIIEKTNIFNTSSSTTGHGILIDTVTNSKIVGAQLHGNQNAGVELVGDNSTIAIIESEAIKNDKGFEFAAGSTASCCLVQDSRALNNTTAGFVHATTPLTTTFIGNEAQCNGARAEDNYVIADPQHNAINLQELAWSDGSFKTISPGVKKTGKLGKKSSGNAACGARFTNLRVVREHANPCK